jgi:hemerythrin superfamily protein
MVATAREQAQKPREATAMLRADHKLVSELFDQFESARSSTKKKELVEEICKELTIHAQLEEEIFYPAVKQALHDKELVPEAKVEHATLKNLIAEVQDMDVEDEMWEARVKVLGEYVKHHVKEEQGEMFPKAKSADLDMKELGALMLKRKQELMKGLE